jgi:regulator of replication initiation timing
MSLAMKSQVSPSIRCILVYDDPSFLKKNRIEEKLAQRGLNVVRAYETSTRDLPTAETFADVGVVVLYGASGGAGGLTRWKDFADRCNARFFRVPHQVARPEWHTLEEWIGRQLEASPVSQLTPERVDYWKRRAEEAESNAASDRAAVMRAQADLEEAKAQVIRINQEIQDLRKRTSQSTGDTVTLLKERDELRSRLSGFETQASRINKVLQDKVKQLEEQNRVLTETREALMRGQDKLRDERDQAIEAARKAKAELAQASQGESGAKFAWLVPLHGEALVFATKLDALVQEGILEFDEARTKWFAKYGAVK